jgi:hypothetical protein
VRRTCRNGQIESMTATQSRVKSRAGAEARLVPAGPTGAQQTRHASWEHSALPSAKAKSQHIPCRAYGVMRRISGRSVRGQQIDCLLRGRRKPGGQRAVRTQLIAIGADPVAAGARADSGTDRREHGLSGLLGRSTGHVLRRRGAGEHAQLAHCATLHRAPGPIRSATFFPWWPRRIKKRHGPKRH